MSAALTKGRVTQEYEPLTVIRSYPMKASTQIWQGGIVCLDSTGYAVPGATSTTQLAVGVAQESQLSSTGDGTSQILVHIGVFHLQADSAFAQTNVGSLCYIVDDQDVSLNATSKSIAGTVAAIESDGSPWVAIGLEAAIDNTTLTAYIASVASTATPGGASLVGVFDTAGLYTATTVEAALAEVVKKANASLGNPITFPVNLASVTASGNVVARFTPGVAGTISKLDASVYVPVTTTGKAATFTAAIATTATTGGAVAVNSTAAATLGAIISGSAVTAANTFTAAQQITIVATSVTAFAEGQVILQLFLASA